MSFVSTNSDLDKYLYLKNGELVTKWNNEHPANSWWMQQELQTCFPSLCWAVS